MSIFLEKQLSPQGVRIGKGRKVELENQGHMKNKCPVYRAPVCESIFWIFLISSFCLSKPFFFQCFSFSLHQVGTLLLSPRPSVPGGEDPATHPLLRPLPWSEQQWTEQASGLCQVGLSCLHRTGLRAFPSLSPSSEKYSMSRNCAPGAGPGPGTQGRPFLESSAPSTLALGKWDGKGTSA